MQKSMNDLLTRMYPVVEVRNFSYSQLFMELHQGCYVKTMGVLGSKTP